MKIIDISWPLAPDVTGRDIQQEVMFSGMHNVRASALRVSRLFMSSRSGTHVSAPACVLRTGTTIDQVGFTQLIGTAFVLDLTDVEESIGREDLEQYDLAKNSIILLKTRNSELAENAPYDKEFMYLHTLAAQYCCDLGIKAIGIDYIDLECDHQNYEVHKLLLSHNVGIIKGLRLAHVPEGVYFLVCLPLAIVGLEAAPARAILFEDFL